MAHLVDGVTKFDKAFYGKAAEAETIRKMIVAAGKDVRVLVIKLADRLHNMRTLDARSPASRARIASATHEVLVPLCDRLGIQALKRELDDVVLYHLEPEAYAAHRRARAQPPGLERLPRGRRSTRRQGALRRSQVDAEVAARPRHYYSIWKDTVAGDHPVPLDLPRIVVDRRRPGDRLLRRARRDPRPVAPGAGPVQGLHRLAEEQPLPLAAHHGDRPRRPQLVEVLIRTESMHRCAEYGVAASYRYPKPPETSAERPAPTSSPGSSGCSTGSRTTTDAAQFLASLRCDLPRRRSRSSPTGRQVVLPAGATPVDLAYELGTEHGDHCLAATDQRAAGPAVARRSTTATWSRSSPRPTARESSRTRPRPAPRVARLRQVAARADADQPLVRRPRTSRASRIADKVRLGRATIGLTLRKHDRGLASELPLRRLADELGYPDLETMLVAVVDRAISPGHRGRPAHRAGRPPRLSRCARAGSLRL